MNRGNLPGYYFDEEKKKYFKIQANHIVPENAKYSKTNAKIERRETKKRKRKDKYHRDVVRMQTVVRAKPFTHPLLSGAGLRRELGRSPYRAQHTQRDAAFVNGLEASETELEIQGYTPEQASLADAHWISDISQMLVAVRHGVASHAVYTFHCEGDWGAKKTCERDQPLHAFHDPIRSFEYISEASDTYSPGRAFILASSAQTNLVSGNVFLALVRDIGSDDDLPPYSDPEVLKIGTEYDLTWDCKFERENWRFACGGTFGATVRNVVPAWVDFAKLEAEDSGEVFALDWLNPNTLALGLKPFSECRGNHAVVLWDIRSRGTVQRIQRPDKISGLRRLDRTGNNLVVASSHDINLYDLRYASKNTPVVNFEHKTGSPTVHMSILNEDLLATTDHRNQVQVYSLRSGTHLRSLLPYRGRKGLISKPRWQNDPRGVPYLQACVGNTIQRWS
ncbi:hypothetical protein PRZ48_003316 [Zasmidium cellare]|uniref:Uncharacterized protein n=1 Tax=Zasmidium cellare TaxID=395010 RepID=A0ABR0EW04_ZASCE|nr:hypothetical protein PRZ48_003316 [Zasmidium cellare]